MGSARRSWRLDSKEIFDVLVNDVDSDIEEDPEIQIEEVIQDLQEVVSFQDQDNDDACQKTYLNQNRVEAGVARLPAAAAADMHQLLSGKWTKLIDGHTKQCSSCLKIQYFKKYLAY
ncbi:unnamed protein product [Parnassius apollo]|uniref:(apollo) hypothetical protein n=1 Tax=Parnassius apollo TaxID=110799 RepID=A0A8S3W280_PARAO|nr:unnamed protein product [Parnassius apollo]